MSVNARNARPLVLPSSHFLVDLDRLRKSPMVHAMYLRHVSLPVVLSRECFPTCSRIVAALYGAMELLLLLVTVVDVSL